MKTVKMGIVGVGNIGSYHAQNISDGKISGMELCALCDTDEAVRAELKKSYPDIPIFDNHIEMLEKAELDAVLIATPHYFHPQIAIDSFESGLNVLTEKPAGVYTKKVKLMNSAAEKSGKLFGIMFNQRTNPLFKKARELVQNGELGSLKRFVWIITNWYRTQYYYDSNGWRGTYGGEGGGVLSNQAPHNLDIMQWICGMPKSVYASLGIGKYHNIEVEDEANIFLEYENGMTAEFLTSTGEPVGTNRIEITGTGGKMVIENNCIKLWKLKEDERKFCFDKKIGFYEAPYDYSEITSDEKETAHIGILQNFANALLHGEPLIASGYDGICELEIANASYLSHWQNKKIVLPVDEDEYLKILKEKAKDYNEKAAEKNKNDKAESRWQVRW